MRKQSAIAQLNPGYSALEMWEEVFTVLKKEKCLKKEYRIIVANDLKREGAGKTHLSSPENIRSLLSLFPESKTLLLRENTSPTKRDKQSLSWSGKTGYFTAGGNEFSLGYIPVLISSFSEKNLLTNAFSRSSEYSVQFSGLVTGHNDADLTAAPGLHNSRVGYLEGVSAEMWFGQAFWQYASCTQDDILSADWLEVEERTNHLYVKAWPEPFNTAEGEQGEVQRRLLKLLFDIG